MQEVSLVIDDVSLGGSLGHVRGAPGLVLFAHGSGSSRRSPRNRRVAEHLRSGGLSTLLFDLLTEEESSDRRLVFDIPLLARRLSAAAEWARRRDDCRGVTIGYFGPSTGAGAALVAAADDPLIGAIVARGGRPDLAGAEALARVTAPTLLIVGGEDRPVIEMNREAAAQMTCETRLIIVPGATHLFEERGTMERVEELAAEWFGKWLGTSPRR